MRIARRRANATRDARDGSRNARTSAALRARCACSSRYPLSVSVDMTPRVRRACRSARTKDPSRRSVSSIGSTGPTDWSAAVGEPAMSASPGTRALPRARAPHARAAHAMFSPSRAGDCTPTSSSDARAATTPRTARRRSRLGPSATRAGTTTTTPTRSIAGLATTPSGASSRGTPLTPALRAALPSAPLERWRACDVSKCVRVLGREFARERGTAHRASDVRAFESYAEAFESANVTGLEFAAMTIERLRGELGVGDYDHRLKLFAWIKAHLEVRGVVVARFRRFRHSCRSGSCRISFRLARARLDRRLAALERADVRLRPDTRAA